MLVGVVQTRVGTDIGASQGAVLTDIIKRFLKEFVHLY